MKHQKQFHERYDTLRKKKDSKSIRKSNLLASLSLCDNDNVRIDLLLEMVLQLQDNIVKLQEDYINVVLQIKNIKSQVCAPLPF